MIIIIQTNINLTNGGKMENLYMRQEEFNLKTDITPCIIGCGGIGYHVAKMLAMAGVENIILFDNDVIEEHNLNRLDLPISTIGMNKTDVVKKVINQLRPNCEVVSYGYKFNPEVLDTLTVDITHIIDCTDVHSAQLDNQSFAKNKGYEYIKAGYNSDHISLSSVIAEWDTSETPDGYTIIPSYVVPAVVIAALVVHRILTNTSKDLSCSIDDLFIMK